MNGGPSPSERRWTIIAIAAVAVAAIVGSVVNAKFYGEGRAQRFASDEDHLPLPVWFRRH
jgi:hypothetical protein